MYSLLQNCFQTSEDDVSQFDTRFTLQTPIDSPDESTLSASANLMFQVIKQNSETHRISRVVISF